MQQPLADNPIIVQGDSTVLLDTASLRFAEARDALGRFAELVKAPEYMHTYRITPLSIWNARSTGMAAGDINDLLQGLARFVVPAHVLQQITDLATRYGRLKLLRRDGLLFLQSDDESLAARLAAQRELEKLLGERVAPTEFAVAPVARGPLKQALVRIGYPAEDIAGYTDGDTLAIDLRQQTVAGNTFQLRSYQSAAAETFHQRGSNRGGSGVIVLPCGAGKTIVGLACMSQLSSSTLILTTSVSAVRQWIDEILDKTSLKPEDVGEYSGLEKRIRPVTIATYQIMTSRKSRDAGFEHLALFDQCNWGLIIYDEVHLLPAPVFQITAGLQARRRLGLTATLVREDGREEDVFALIGPKRVDVPWKVLEGEGWIARATCTEIRVDLPESTRMPYAVAAPRDKFRIASENPAKLDAARQVIAAHAGEQVLVLGMFVDQLKRLADELKAPLITGSTVQKRRDDLFRAFRNGEVPLLLLSKVGNFAIDLPDASVAVQVSGTFGSRQEEAQRLGRILRPKSNGNQAHFYSIVSRHTVEEEFAMKRQLFLCEQGYSYEIAQFPAPAKG